MLKLKLYNNEDNNRYEFHFKEYRPFIQYRLRGNTIVLLHTEVPDELEGQGIGTELVKSVLADIRSRGLKLKPYCPFVKSFINENPEWKDLL